MFFFLGHLHAFLQRPCLSRALGCGARRGLACTPRRMFRSRTGSVERALGVQSREISQEITGLLSAELELSKTMENPHVSCFAPPMTMTCLVIFIVLHCCKSSLLCGSHGTTRIKFVWTTTMRVWTLHMLVCSVYVMVRVLVSRCVRVCIGVLEPHVSDFFCFFFSACCCCRIMSVSHRPSSSQALHSVAATVQQQSHGKFV